MNLEQLSDKDLILKINDGHKEQGFSILHKKYKLFVTYNISKKIRDYETVKDLTQEVFIKLYNNRESFNPRYRFATWLYKITQNIVNDYLRTKKNWRFKYSKSNEDGEYLIKSQGIADTPIFQVPLTPEEEFIKNEKKQALLKEINKLPPNLIDVVRHRINYQRGHRKIAEELEISYNNSRWKSHFGIKLLKERLKKRGFND
jgi:RNA polymerase sigma-70 factor (ECF subfamily)